MFLNLMGQYNQCLHIFDQVILVIIHILAQKQVIAVTSSFKSDLR